MIDLSIDIGVKKAIIKDKSNKNLFFNWHTKYGRTKYGILFVSINDMAIAITVKNYYIKALTK